MVRSDEHDPKPHGYAEYLRLDTLLSCQQLQTESRDELLFITIHQSKELWFKLIIHELQQAVAALFEGRALAAHKMLNRVCRIESTLVHTWDILQTLSPDEYASFRPVVGREGASGFQSYQYRVVEFLLGVKDRKRRFQRPDGGYTETDVLDMHAEDGTARKELEKIWRSPSVYDATVALLARRFPDRGIEYARDYSEPYVRAEAVFEAWMTIYRDAEQFMDLFQLGEKLIDVEDVFRQWRFRHLTTVSRIIGFKAGTGGSAGVSYLLETANEAIRKPLFVELWEVRDALLA